MNIKPLRSKNESDIIPFFGFHGLTANKGTFVKAETAGLNFDDFQGIEDLSPIDSATSAQFNVPWLVVPATSGDQKSVIVGMLLLDHRTVDENGYPLIFEPRKAAEIECTTSGQATPIVREGFFLYSGIDGIPAYGSGLAISDTTPGALKVVQPLVTVSGGLPQVDNPAMIGKCLGAADSQGYVPIYFSV
jgi:hypothetical protein